MDEKSIIRIIKDARAKVIEHAKESSEAYDIRSKIEWQNRRYFLDDLSIQFLERETGMPLPKIVFISYSYSTALIYYRHLEEILKQAGFNVITGFNPSEGDKGGVLTRVLTQIKRCSVYLGILTKEMKVSTQNGEVRWAPSVWTIEEKGMALAFGKPFVLMVEEGIHEDYWRKTTPERVHELFNQQNFYGKALDVVEAIKSRYQEALIDFMDRGIPMRVAPSELG